MFQELVTGGHLSGEERFNNVIKETYQASQLDPEKRNEEYRGALRSSLDTTGKQIADGSWVLCLDGSVGLFSDLKKEGKVHFDVSGKANVVALDKWVDFKAVNEKLSVSILNSLPLTLEIIDTSTSSPVAKGKLRLEALEKDQQLLISVYLNANDHNYTNVSLTTEDESAFQGFSYDNFKQIGGLLYRVESPMKKHLGIDEDEEVLVLFEIPPYVVGQEKSLDIQMHFIKLVPKDEVASADAQEKMVTVVKELIFRSNEAISREMAPNFSYVKRIGSDGEIIEERPLDALEVIDATDDGTTIHTMKEGVEVSTEPIDMKKTFSELKAQLQGTIDWFHPVIRRNVLTRRYSSNFQFPWMDTDFQNPRVAKYKDQIKNKIDTEIEQWEESAAFFEESDTIVWFLQKPENDEENVVGIGLGDIIYTDALMKVLAARFPQKKFIMVSNKIGALPENRQYVPDNLVYYKTNQELKENEDFTDQKVGFLDGDITILESYPLLQRTAKIKELLTATVAPEEPKDEEEESFKSAENRGFFDKLTAIFTGKGKNKPIPVPPPLFVQGPAPSQVESLAEPIRTIVGHEYIEDFSEEEFPNDRADIHVDVVSAFNLASQLYQANKQTGNEDSWDLVAMAEKRKRMYKELYLFPHQVELHAMKAALLTQEPFSPQEIIDALPRYEYPEAPENEHFDVVFIYDSFSTDFKILALQNLCQMIEEAIQQGKRPAVVKGLDNPEIVDYLREIFGDQLAIVEKPSVSEVMSVSLAAKQVVVVDTVFAHLLDLAVEQRLEEDDNATIPQVDVVYCTDVPFSPTQFAPRSKAIDAHVIDGQMVDGSEAFYRGLIKE